MINIIVAMGENRVIGKEGKLPWRLPEDLKHFKEKTTGHTVIMGRKTFESIGKPLPERANVVITRHIHLIPKEFLGPGFVLTNSLDWTLEVEKRLGNEVWIIGGAEIYRQTIDKADMLYVTLINHDFDGDAYFPEINEAVWELVEQSAMQYGGENAPYHYCYQRYQKK